MSNKIYPSLACRLEFFAEDADGLPVSGLTHSDVSAAGYCRIQDGVMSSTTSLSLTSSAAFTASVSAGQFVTINSARGHYAIDCPSGASAIAYDYALAYVTFTAGHVVTAIRHEIDASLYLTTANNATLGALSGRIPAALVSGRMDCSVGAMANDVVTAAAIASNALSIAKFAADIGTTAYASNPLAKAVWERLLSAMTTAGSAGKKLSDQANADVSALALQSTLNAVGVLATAIDAKTSQLAFTTPNKVDASAVLDSAAFTEIKGAGWDSSTDTLEKIRDAISIVSSISVVIPSPVEEIIGMPETLEIGDSYDGDTSIKLYVRDENDAPVTSFAGHDLTDGDFAPTFTIAPTPGSARGRVVGTVTWIPASGPDEGYLKVEIPSLQSRRAVEGESSVQCVLKWDGYEKSILTTTVRWLPRI